MKKHLFGTLRYKNTFSLLFYSSSNTTTCLISMLHSRWDICYLLFIDKAYLDMCSGVRRFDFRVRKILSSPATISELRVPVNRLGQVCARKVWLG